MKKGLSLSTGPTKLKQDNHSNPLGGFLFPSSGSQAWVPKEEMKSQAKMGKDSNLRRNLWRSEEVMEENSVTTNTTINLNALTLCHGKYK